MEDDSIRTIAEIGTNWVLDSWEGQHRDEQRCLEVVLSSISLAAETGAWGVKFQLGLESLYSEKRAPAKWTEIQRYYMSPEWLRPMSLKARSCGVTLWASMFDIRTIGVIAPYLDGLKVASGDMVYDPLVDEVLSVANEVGLPVAISTGGATYTEIAHVIDLVHDSDFRGELILMQCDPRYPAFTENANLKSLLVYYGDKNLVLGYSDHTHSSVAACTAVGLGYRVFEKHFRPFYDAIAAPDYAAALPILGMSAYVNDVREAHAALGVLSCERHILDAEALAAIRRGEDGRRPIEGVGA